MRGALVETEGLVCGYRPGRPVLAGVDITVEAGATVALVGRSGSGKTTLLKTILGIVAPRGGRVAVLGRAHPQRPPPGTVGYVPQGLGLVRHATVLRNVAVGTLRQAGRWRGAAGAFTPAQVGAATEALERVGLGHKLDARPLHLSGGERRRVAVARALAQRPALLLADEMLSELDARTAATVLDAVRELQRTHGTGVLLVEHDVDAACTLADVVCCIAAEGRLVAAPPGPDRARLAHEMLSRAAPPPG